ncbi:MAG: DUF177 domain-containing protein [Nitrospirae bacterium]|nr:DUF177 domain-containing protein [Candidatus Troglogloeales bacterium]
MKVNVQNIPSEGLHFDLAGHPVILESKSLVVNGPVEGMLSVQKLGNVDVHIRGSLSAHLLLSCGRCLNSFDYPVASEFYVDCTHEEKSPISGQEHRLYGEELNLHFYQGDTLEINEIIENQIHLEIPMAPLCKEDCKGLCPICGEDLNLALCGGHE